MKYIKSGLMRTYLQHQAFQGSQDSFGDSINSYNQSGNYYYAYVNALDGKEALVAQAIKPTIRWEVVMRYTPSDSFSPRDILVLDDGTKLNIEVVYDVERRHHQWRLLCSSVPT